MGKKREAWEESAYFQAGLTKCCCCRNKILTPGTARTSGVDDLHFPMWKELTSNQNQWRNQLRGNMAAATDRPIRTSSQFWVPLIPGYLLRMRSHEVCCGRAPHPFCCTGKYRQKSQHGLYGHIDCSSYVASQPGYQSMYWSITYFDVGVRKSGTRVIFKVFLLSEF